ncbi:uncharacterized protein AMSG_00469 [Thecamonas trahens ATCC 50062]|uniref:Uncharacterized protein n=1 Tax=Thecamonas trahens ATCC 50062 TaxID=461836 RepID=A0A0L0D8J1_THETB|nr:hypothetical protein AMSG_00469 [Thecamonas trahens ATCC 50062]KNC48692.1 hypothetical protein AMSG_00469 [Thecamonas trahens ATCC 50062]|eukprot:XP_013762748.1 hypothetical protein AMSG_00469 [Thecamonas trahens ATCC 50062]
MSMRTKVEGGESGRDGFVFSSEKMKSSHQLLRSASNIGQPTLDAPGRDHRRPTEAPASALDGHNVLPQLGGRPLGGFKGAGHLGLPSAPRTDVVVDLDTPNLHLRFSIEGNEYLVAGPRIDDLLEWLFINADGVASPSPHNKPLLAGSPKQPQQSSPSPPAPAKRRRTSSSASGGPPAGSSSLESLGAAPLGSSLGGTLGSPLGGAGISQANPMSGSSFNVLSGMSAHNLAIVSQSVPDLGMVDRALSALPMRFGRANAPRAATQSLMFMPSMDFKKRQGRSAPTSRRGSHDVGSDKAAYAPVEVPVAPVRRVERLTCITAMPEYRNVSLEELRWNSYCEGNRGVSKCEVVNYKVFNLDRSSRSSLSLIDMLPIAPPPPPPVAHGQSSPVAGSGEQRKPPAAAAAAKSPLARRTSESHHHLDVGRNTSAIPRPTSPAAPSFTALSSAPQLSIAAAGGAGGVKSPVRSPSGPGSPAAFPQAPGLLNRPAAAAPAGSSLRELARIALADALATPQSRDAAHQVVSSLAPTETHRPAPAAAERDVLAVSNMFMALVAQRALDDELLESFFRLPGATFVPSSLLLAKCPRVELQLRGPPAWKITELNIQSLFRVTDASLDRMLVGIGATLKALDISFCSQITGKGLSSVATHCPGLLSLSAATTLCGAKRYAPADLIRVITSCPSLQKLDLSGSLGVTPPVARHIADLGRSLASLRLSRCYSLTSQKPLLNIVQSCRRLQILDITGIMVSPSLLLHVIGLPVLVALSASMLPADVRAVNPATISAAPQLEYFAINAVTQVSTLSPRARAAYKVLSTLSTEQLTQLLVLSNVPAARTWPRSRILSLCLEYYVHGVPSACPMCSSYLRRFFATDVYRCANVTCAAAVDRFSLTFSVLPTDSVTFDTDAPPQT